MCRHKDNTGTMHLTACWEMMQEQFLQRLGMADAVEKLGIGWGSVIGIVITAAILTLCIGFAAYHFRMRYHAQQQVKEIMYALLQITL